MSLLWQKISGKEKKWLLLLIIMTLVLSSSPFLYGWLNAPEGSTYNGLHAFTPGDTHVYYSYIEQAKQGHILFADLYTLEPHTKTLNIFWLGVGLGAKIFNLSAELAYQLARVILTPILILLIYLIAAFFFENKKERMIASIAMIFSSGAGGLMYNILDLYDYTTYGYYHWPMDLWVAESNTYLTLLHSPHFIASLIGVLGVFFFSLLAVESKKYKWSLATGAIALALYLFHPFQIFTTWAVLLAFLLSILVTKKKLVAFYPRHLGIIFLISLPALIYYWLLVSNDWVIQQKAMQNITLTPSGWLLLVSYGFLWPAIVAGVYFLAKTKKALETKWLFVLAWLPAQIILIYSPLDFQRRLTTGLHITIALLASFGLIYLHNIIKNKYTRNSSKFFLTPLLITTLGLLLFFSTLFNFTREIYIVKTQNPLLYFSSDEKSMFDWINSQTNEQSSFLALKEYGNFIPGQTGRRVFVGHGVETANAISKFQLAEWAYASNTTTPEVISILQKNNIDYVVFSENENTLSSKLKESPTLTKEFKEETIEIYSVIYD